VVAPAELPQLHSWVLNDFPYAFEEGMEHHLLWSTYEMTEEEVCNHTLTPLCRTSFNSFVQRSHVGAAKDKTVSKRRI
jgi:hypothetical protein